MPGRTRTGHAARATAVASAAILLTGCGGELSLADVEESIRDGLADEGVELDSVDCPEGLAAEVGAAVVCDVELSDEDALGEQVDRVRVVVTSVDGNDVRYRLEPLAVGASDDAGTGDGSEGEADQE